ncbi:MAG: hypothetical protein ABSA02_27880 [Trebonia sp.]
MSFADNAVLWLHLLAAIFTIGPGTAAIMSTPRYIRRQNTVLVGYLYRTTRIYSFAALLTLIFGGVLAGLMHEFSQWWISAAEVARAAEAAHAAEAAPAGQQTEAAAAGGDQPATAVASEAQPTITTDPSTGLRLAAVERGRIASMGGVTALIWLVILVLMVWH